MRTVLGGGVMATSPRYPPRSPEATAEEAAAPGKNGVNLFVHAPGTARVSRVKRHGRVVTPPELEEEGRALEDDDTWRDLAGRVGVQTARGAYLREIGRV